MPKPVLDEPRFRNEEAAYTYVESIVWPNGRVCPHCGVVDKSGLLRGKSTRIGVYKCYACRKPFTVKVGTIFEKSHIAMHIWLQAMHLMCSSKKGFSANQFCRVLGVDFKTGWFIGHRIREAMNDAALPDRSAEATCSSRPTKPLSAVERETEPTKLRRLRKPSSPSLNGMAVSARDMSGK